MFLALLAAVTAGIAGSALAESLGFEESTQQIVKIACTFTAGAVALRLIEWREELAMGQSDFEEKVRIERPGIRILLQCGDSICSSCGARISQQEYISPHYCPHCADVAGNALFYCGDCEACNYTPQ